MPAAGLQSRCGTLRTMSFYLGKASAASAKNHASLCEGVEGVMVETVPELVPELRVMAFWASLILHPASVISP